MTALPSLACILSRHTLREALIASFKAAQRNGVALNAASLAGRALAQHDSAEAALESIRALRRELRTGREDIPLSEDEWDLVGACAYVRKVQAEESAAGDDMREYRRRAPTISDEATDSEGEVE